ncbi:hypothetical protein [Aliivibrio fischeri]|uniref:hypothetical protein n=1 Tax=Aliivibrio fischeri TaxID=668 RepID=UPI0012DAC739|nr:hypothetical protein [Aliivibrio fischeri]MUJ38316.1 hypothetical protein [Aliivibrio fischeri]
MKKTLLSAAVFTTTLVSAVSVYAADPVPPTPKPPQTKIHWEGSIADIIPGDNLIITGNSGATTIATGDLNLEKNGTFDSSEIILETHRYDSVQRLVGDLTSATWKITDLNYRWGENKIGKTSLKVFDMLSASPTTELVVGTDILNVERMSLKVKNETPLDVTDITDTSATARVDLTMTAALVL